jgi:hypothetical protein
MGGQWRETSHWAAGGLDNAATMPQASCCSVGTAVTSIPLYKNCYYTRYPTAGRSAIHSALQVHHIFTILDCNVRSVRQMKWRSGAKRMRKTITGLQNYKCGGRSWQLHLADNLYIYRMRISSSQTTEKVQERRSPQMCAIPKSIV